MKKWEKYYPVWLPDLSGAVLYKSKEKAYNSRNATIKEIL